MIIDQIFVSESNSGCNEEDWAKGMTLEEHEWQDASVIAQMIIKYKLKDWQKRDRFETYFNT